VNPRQLVTAIFLDAVAAADPELAVRRSLKDDPLVAGATVVIASGKAAVAMTRGFAAVTDITRGVAVTTIEEQAPVPVIMGGHPEPNPGSVAAAWRALELAASAGPGVTVVYLVSGGSSALLALPAGELTLDDLVATNRLLLASGADIAEVNTVRKHLSLIKGGYLAKAASDARLMTLVLSDVVGDRLDVVGSGPTVPDPTTFTDAIDVLGRFELMGRVPANVADHLIAGAAGVIEETPKTGHPDHEIRVVAGGATAAAAAVASARRRGLTAAVVTTTLSGEARTAAAEAVATRRPGIDLLVFVGETTVTVSGTGLGGRNQEAALAAALAIEGSSTTFLAADTDGIDGATHAAGAVVDAGTTERGRAVGLDAIEALADNDANGYLTATGDLFITGPTGTNVADLWLVHHGER